MQRMTFAPTTHEALPIPRGWIVLGAALTSWVLFVSAGAAFTQLFGFVASAVL